MPEKEPELEKLKVFISYSRADLDFADQLVKGLESCGFDPTIDRTDLKSGEEFRQRLKALIREAGTIVFVLSPSSLASPDVAWEVDEAAALNKRLLPIICTPLGNAHVPERLASLQFTHFYPEAKFRGTGWGDGLAKLVTALNQDLPWVREHTRLQEQAAHWVAGKRAPDRLLKGSDIASAKTWLSRRLQPEPTALHLEFIEASEREETHLLSTRQKQLADMAAAQERERKALESEKAAVEKFAREQQERARLRRQVFAGLWGTVIVLSGLVISTGYFWRQADAQRADAVKAKTSADASRLEADRQRASAVLSQQRLLADAVDRSASSGDGVTATLIALEAIAAGRAGGKIAPELPTSLYIAIHNVHERRLIPLARQATLSPNGRHIATAHGSGRFRVFDVATGNEVADIDAHQKPITNILYSADSMQFMTASNDGSARFWGGNDYRPGPIIKLNERISQIAFESTGRLIATSSDDVVKVWSRETGIVLFELKGHSGLVDALSFSRDGRKLVSGSWDDTAIVWDIETGTLTVKLAGHTDWVRSAVFSANGSRVLTASDDRTARIWDTHTGRELVRMEGHKDYVSWAGLAPDEKTVATVSLDRTARLWDATTGKALFVMSGHDKQIETGAFDTNGRYLATGSNDTTVRVWDVATGRQVAVLAGHTSAVSSVAFDPSGRRLMSTSSAEGTARLWDIDAKPTSRVLVGLEEELKSAAFNADGQRALITTASGKFQLWDTRSGRRLTVPQLNEGSIQSAAFAPGNRRIVLAKADGSLSILDALTGEQRVTVQARPGELTRRLWSLDGRRLVTRSADDKTVQLWNVETGEHIRRLDALADPIENWGMGRGAPRFYVRAKGFMYVFDSENGDFLQKLGRADATIVNVSTTSDFRRLVTTYRDNTVSLWDADTGEEQRLAEQPFAYNPSFTASSDAKLVAVWGGGSDRIEVWNLETKTHSKSLGIGYERASNVAFSSDSRVLAASFTDRKVRVWNTADLSLAPITLSHEERVTQSAMSPDNRWVATASIDKLGRLWDRTTGELKQVFRGHTSEVTRIAFSSDSRWVVTRSEDNKARLWNVATGLPAAVWPMDPDLFAMPVLSPDGRFAITQTDTTAEIWPVLDDIDQLTERARALVTRCLTAEQRTLLDLDDTPPEWCTVEGHQKWPYDPAGVIAQGDRHSVKKEFDAALDAYQKVLTTNPNLRPEVISGMADAHEQRARAIADIPHPESGKLQPAMSDVQKALELDASLAAAHITQGFLLVHQGRGEEALASFAKGTETGAIGARVLLGRGLAQELLGRKDLAVAAYLEADQLNLRSGNNSYQREARSRLKELTAGQAASPKLDTPKSAWEFDDRD